MHLTLFTAMSAVNPSIMVDMAQNGNMYEAVVWHRGEHRTVRKYVAHNYEEVKGVFDSWCESFNMTSVKEVERDVSDFYNID